MLFWTCLTRIVVSGCLCRIYCPASVQLNGQAQASFLGGGCGHRGELAYWFVHANVLKFVHIKQLSQYPAFQAVVLVGEIQPGDNVLVHAGASGVGIAAIQLSHAYKA